MKGNWNEERRTKNESDHRATTRVQASKYNVLVRTAEDVCIMKHYGVDCRTTRHNICPLESSILK